LESLRNFVLIGVGPLVGAAMLTWLLVESVIDMSDPENSYSGVTWFSLGPPLVIGSGIAAAGVVTMLVWRLFSAAFWSERPSVAEPEETSDVTAVPDEAAPAPAEV
ncbi:MAG: APC family permease, partial [Streptomyces sp.]|nr:APC family permease [Streptomyces sp.]